MRSKLHEILVARQPLAELARKQQKALRRAGIYTQEDIDWASRSGLYRWRRIMRPEPTPRLP